MTPDANIFTEVLKRYNCVMNKNLPGYDKESSTRSKISKRISVTGSLNGLVSCVVQVMTAINEKYPSAIQPMNPVQASSSHPKHYKKVSGQGGAGGGGLGGGGGELGGGHGGPSNSLHYQQHGGMQQMRGQGMYVPSNNRGGYLQHQFGGPNSGPNNSGGWRRSNRPPGSPGGRGSGGRGRFDIRRPKPLMGMGVMEMRALAAQGSYLLDQPLPSMSGLAVSPATSPSNAMRYNYYHNQSDDIYGGQMSPQMSPVSAQQLSDGTHDG